MTPRLVAITDAGRELSAHLPAYRALGRALGPSLVVMVRLPGRDARDALAWARALLAEGLQVSVAERGDVARALGVARLHLGEASVSTADARAWMGDGAWLTRACHDPHMADRAADAALLAPVFASPGKGAPLGVGAITDAARRVPVIALGGVDATNARACFDAGASGVAAIRACLDQPDALARAVREAPGA